MLNHSFARLVAGLALVLLVGFILVTAFRATPAAAQEDPGPFVVGETVTLRYASTGSQECRVQAIRGSFIKCAHAKEDQWFSTGGDLFMVIKKR